MINTMDHYATLGVERTASQDEIKKAYRSLSKTYHPDVGGDEERFKQINEAYSVLGDPAKRENYDQRGAGHDFFSRVNWGQGSNLSDMFDQFFGQHRGGQMQRGADYQVDIHISFEEAYKGTTKQFAINGQEIAISFEKGVRNGQRFRLKGKGAPHPFNTNLPNGDLIMLIHVVADARFVLQGDDIWVETTLPWWDIILGTRLGVWTPEGLLNLTVPEGTRPSSTLRIKGKGFPIYNTDRCGDLLCKVNPSYPTLTAEQLELIKKIKDHG